jgi:large subunit ribosomal protein L23
MAKTKTTTSSKNTTAKSADVTLLKHPRITEKAANLAGHATYTFDVAVGATKSEIIKAFVMTYKATPIKVNTVNVKPKSFFKRGKLGFGKRSKKAYVVLPKGTTIDIM